MENQKEQIPDTVEKENRKEQASPAEDTGKEQTASCGKPENGNEKARAFFAKAAEILQMKGEEFWKDLFIYALLLILFAWILANLATVGSVLGKVFSLIAPFLIGFCIAFLINMLLAPLEKLWKKCTANSQKAQKLMRPVCLSVSTLLILGLLFTVVFMVIPALAESFSDFSEDIPVYTEKLNAWWDRIVVFAADHGFVFPEKNLDPQQLLLKLNQFLQNEGKDILASTLGATTSIVTGIVNFVLALVFALYFLADKENIMRRLDEACQIVMPEEKYSRMKKVVTLCNQSFTSFISGQLLDAAIIGILCFIGMLVFRFPNAGVISVLVGFTALIPVFGAWMGGGIGALLILLTEPEKTIWFIVFLLTLQQLEGNLIYPRVVGQSVGLPGILVLVAVTVGGSAFGVLGMIFAVPLCAVFYELWKEYLAKKKALNQSEEKGNNNNGELQKN